MTPLQTAREKALANMGSNTPVAQRKSAQEASAEGEVGGSIPPGGTTFMGHEIPWDKI